MIRRFLLSALLAIVATGCDGESETCDLPAQPQLNPNAQAGVIGFELTRMAEFATIDAVFINGGCAPLQIDLATVRLEGPDSAEFALGDVFPADGRVLSRNAVGFPITFTSPGRGVFLTTLKFESDAENFPVYELEVVGPGAPYDYQNPPLDSDIEFFEDPVDIEPSAVFPEPAAFARFYNLGGRTLQVFDYNLDDPVNFKFLDGTAEPSARCVYGALCPEGAGAAQGCCNGGLTCRCRDFKTDGVTCSQIVAQERPIAPPPCPTGNECDPYGLDCVGGECVDACTTSDDCPLGELCEAGACGPPAQTCSSVNVTSGQFNIVGVEFTEEATPGFHQTELEVLTDDPDSPTATVTIQGTK